MEVILYSLSSILIVGTLLPISDSKHWFIRGQAYFRFWYLWFNLLAIVLLFGFVPFTLLSLSLICLLLFSSYLCLRDVLPFTKLYKKEIKSAKADSTTSDLSFLIYNVYQENNKYENLLKEVVSISPDIILLLETDDAWDLALKPLESTFPYCIKEIRSDTYGIVLYSKIKPIEQSIDYLTDNGIPSIDCLLIISDQKIRIRGLHPRPPIPGEALSSEQKDNEFIKAARLLNMLPDDELSIVIGDLNDVAWSKASKRFKEVTGLRDPRVGRGSYSTFPTYSPIRFPLDHIFCSPRLEIVAFKILNNLGSDHFPVYVNFSLPVFEQT